MPDIEVMRVKNGIRHLIYRHRFYASSDWSMSEGNLAEYEGLLNRIELQTPELEYTYLFINNPDYPLLHPAPYHQEGEQERNEVAKEELIQEKLAEFQRSGFDLVVLAKACAIESYSSLGVYLAKYWNNGKWNYNTFRSLLSVQESGAIALDYLRRFGGSEQLPYDSIISDLSNDACSVAILAKVYRIEALRTQKVPLITNASEEIKKEFWKDDISCDECNLAWALRECKKYATLDVYLDQLHMYLADFGLVWNAKDTEDHITEVNDHLGPIVIRPPELQLIEDIESVDYRKSDVYLFAKTLWMLLEHDSIGFLSEYSRSDENVYIYKNTEKHMLETAEPLHRLMEGATKHNWGERITIDDCLFYLEEQLSIITETIPQNKLQEYKYIEQVKHIDATFHPDRKEFSDPSAILRTLNEMSGLA